MAKRSLQERKATAFHEAGHAVACIVQGHPVNKLSIVPDEESLGHCLHPSTYCYDARTHRERRAIAREVIIINYAGWAAEVKFHPDAKKWRSQADDDNAFEMSREFEVFPRRLLRVGDDHHLKYSERLRHEARRLVDRHWPVVITLAEALFRRKRLNGLVIEKIING